MKKYLNKGFTLIELLIVMAILGVLAVVVLVAINPAEQLARTRDAGRVSTVTQVGHAVSAYYTGHNAVYPGAGAVTWDLDMTNSQELSSFPGAITYSLTGTAACTDGAGNYAPKNGVCYKVTAGTDTIAYSRLESKSYNSKCAAAAPNAYILFSVIQGRGGTVCMAAGSEPAPAASYTFVP